MMEKVLIMGMGACAFLFLFGIYVWLSQVTQYQPHQKEPLQDTASNPQSSKKVFQLCLQCRNWLSLWRELPPEKQCLGDSDFLDVNGPRLSRGRIINSHRASHAGNLHTRKARARAKW